MEISVMTPFTIIGFLVVSIIIGMCLKFQDTDLYRPSSIEEQCNNCQNKFNKVSKFCGICGTRRRGTSI